MSARIPAQRTAASAPARICLAGESLDWMTGGPSVVAALPLRTTVQFVTRATTPELVRFEAGAPINATGQAPVAWLGRYPGAPTDLLQAAACVLAEPCRSVLPGGLLRSSTRVPVGAGVSSSAAAAVAACAALLAASDTGLPSTVDVAQAAYAAESGQLRTGAGWMDYLACAYGGVNRIGGGPVPSATRLRDELGCPVLLIDTGDRRATVRTLLGEGGKHERWQADDGDLRRYAELAPAIVDTVAELLSADVVDYPALGELLTEAQTLLRDWVRCSTPLIDECVARAVAAGAYGAKLTGSGHGGCLFALLAEDTVPAVRACLSDLPVRAMLVTTGEPHGVVILPAESEEHGA